MCLKFACFGCCPQDDDDAYSPVANTVPRGRQPPWPQHHPGRNEGWLRLHRWRRRTRRNTRRTRIRYHPTEHLKRPEKGRAQAQHATLRRPEGIMNNGHARCMLAFHRLLLHLLFCDTGLCKQTLKCIVMYLGKFVDIHPACALNKRDIYRLGLGGFKQVLEFFFSSL